VAQALRLLEASGAASGDSLTVGRFCSSSAGNDIIASSGAAVAGGERLLLVANASSGSAAILAGPTPYRVGGLPAETLAPSTLPHDDRHQQTLLVVTLPPPLSVSLQPTTTAEPDRLLAVAWGRSSSGVYLQAESATGDRKAGPAASITGFLFFGGKKLGTKLGQEVSRRRGILV
jgi:hypothetical protein